MKFLLAISRGIDAVTTLIGRIMWWVTLFMVLIGAFNVVTRYAFDLIAGAFGSDVAQALSSNRYLSLQKFAFDLIFLLGAAYVLRSDGHVRVDIVYSSLKPRTKATIDLLGTLLFLLPFCYFILQFSQSTIAASWVRRDASADPGGLPVFIVRTIIPVALALIMTQGVSEIIKHVAFLAGVPDSGSIHETPERSPGEHVTAGTEGI